MKKNPVMCHMLNCTVWSWISYLAFKLFWASKAYVKW